MDYEDWIEGLKPIVDNNQVTYEIESGIFKQLCEEAARPIVKDKHIGIADDAVIWKVSLCGTGDNPVRKECMDNGHIYFVGIDWLRENELAVQVCPKMNDGFEVDYVRMLNEALLEPENFEHLTDLITIRFDKPSIKVSQQQDVLSLFLVTEYLNILHSIVRKGLKRSYYTIEENLAKKVKGKILIGKNIRKNLSKGNITDNVCRYQVYDIDSPENQILKKALRFCNKQLEIYKNAVNIEPLKKKVRLVAPYFDSVSDEISVKSIKSYKGNPVFKEYNQAIKFAQLLLRRYSYDITAVVKT